MTISKIIDKLCNEEGLLDIGKYDHERLREVLKEFELDVRTSSESLAGIVNRVEVIERGVSREYVNMDVKGACVSMQDNNRTMKVFINE